MYDRLLLIAQADGKDLSTWVRTKLGVDGLERLDDERFETARKETDVSRMQREHRALGTKLREKSFVVKEWKSVKKEKVVYWRTAPCTELEATTDGHREKAGQWRLRVVVRSTRGGGFPVPSPLSEERRYYPSLKRYKKAVNRELGFDEFKVKKKPEALDEIEDRGPSSAP